MNKKEILTIILLICVIFSLQAVAAADSGSDSTEGNVLSVDNNVSAYALPSSNTDTLAEVASADSFSDLQGIVDGASTEEIKLTRNYTYKSTDSGSNGISIASGKTVILNGEGKVIIDADHKSRIFNIASGATVTLKGITFINANADGNGGSIYSESALTLENCNFANNTAELSGGAIYCAGDHITISSTNFTNNKAIGSLDAVDGTRGDGGAILLIGSHNIIKDNCIFSNNYARNRGGAIFIHINSTTNSPNATIDNCIFKNNYVDLNGGAVDWQIGAINGTLTNSIFTNNTAKRSGGAVYCNDGNGTIRNCNFTDNHAWGNWSGTIDPGITIVTDTNGGNGGALIWRGSNGSIDGCNFTSNSAGRLGGAIHLRDVSDVTFTNCHFTNNTAGTNGGAIHFNTGANDCTVGSCTFDNNTAIRSAGAIFWIGNDGYLYDTTFTNNTARGSIDGAVAHNGTNTTGGSGGAIIWAGSNGRIIHCDFFDNNATKRGGAIFLESTKDALCSNTTFDDCTFENNIAKGNGGAIAWDGGVREGTILNSVFTNNTAKRSGGAIYWNGYNGTIKNSKFKNNRATGETKEYTLNINMGDTIVKNPDGSLTLGDIIVIQSAKLPSTSTSGYENKLVVLNSSTTTTTYYSEYYIIVVNSTGGYEWKQISESEAALNYTLTLPQDNITNVTVLPDISSALTNNLYILNKSISTSIAHFESWVVNNTKWQNLDSINITVSESIISPVDWAIDQYFGGDGGTILWSGDVGYIYNCTFIDSNSARRGGGAYMTGCDYVTYESCNFTNCTSGTNGGGVDWLAGANYGKIYNCIFNGTQAARSAGAIYYDGWYGDMENITIINTKSNGGALKQSKDKRVNYAGWDSSHWDTNTTGGDAGAIMYTGSFITVYNVTFTNCNASGRGGAVFLQDNHNVTFDLCKFENNIASGTAHNTYNDDKNISSGENSWLTGYGGAIAFDVGAANGTIMNSKFINNTAVRLGGAISFGKGSANATVLNSTFDNNTAKRNGGAISWDGTNGHMEDCTFKNNSALGTDINTVIFNPTSLDDFKHNGTAVPTYTPAGNKKEMYIRYQGHNPITNRSANYTMYVYDGTKWNELEFTTETGPSTVDWAMDEYYGGDGGTIYWRGDVGLVDNCTFIDSNSARRGGGAYMTGSDNITFQNSKFINCTSGTNGGGLDWLAGANYGKVINCTFNNTRAARSAGAIYYDGDHGRMENITIINATNYGGSLKQSKDKRVNYAGWDSSHWDTNTTGGDAGAIMITGDHLYMYNATFTDCNATGRGGAIFLQDNKNATLVLCTFDNNYAQGNANNTWTNYTQERNESNNDTKVNYKLTGHGGAVAFDVNAKDCQIIDSKFYNNLARRNGGAINFDAGSTNNNITHCEFKNNTVYDDGGAINLDHGADYCGIYNSTFYNNTALGRFKSTSKGGTICLVGNNVTVQNSTFTLGVVTANKAEGAKDNETWGGAMFVTGNSTVIKNCTFESCNAVEDGGALYVIGDDCKLYNSTFTSNHAGDDGGAIYWTGVNGFIYNITCTNNKVTGQTLTSSNSKGGTICLIGDFAVLTKSKFEDSSAIVDGGAIYLTGNKVNITESEFINCVVTYTNDGKLHRGGAIYVLGNDSNILDCKFNDSRAQLGGDVFIEGNRVTIDNATSNKAYAYSSGGSVFIQGDYATISNSTVSSSEALISGGAIYIHGIRSTIIYSTFDKSYSHGKGKDSSSGKTYGGGAIYSDGGSYSKVYYSNFTNNVAESDGGAIYWYGGSATKNNHVVGCIFINNTAHGHGTENTKGGGAIYWSMGGTYGVVKDSKFFNNSVQSTATNIAKADGGAILWDKCKHGIIDNCTFDGNFVTSPKTDDSKVWVQGGSVFIRCGNFTLSNSTIKNSWSNKEAGGLYISNKEMIISKTAVDVRVINITFINNTAKSEGTVNNVGGGAVLVKEFNNVVFEDCKFINNTANQGGGVAFIKFIDKSITDLSYFKNCTFSGNNATTNGGSILCDNSDGGNLATLVIYNTTIANSTAENGGGMYVINLNYDNLTFINNTATLGGGLYWNKANVQVKDMTFINNTATDKGGAIYIPTATPTISFNNFTGNKAVEGGAIYVAVASTISNNNFTKNSATCGGAIYVNVGGAVISYNNFTSNMADYGGAIYEPKKDSGVSISNSIFDKNHANVDGGAIYAGFKGADGKQTTYCNFTNNTADGNGGAIYVANTAQTIAYCNFDGNNATLDGGAIYVNANGTSLTVKESTFKNSHARDGGAIYRIGAKAYSEEIYNNTFIKNTASHNGGAVLYIVTTSSSTTIYRDYLNFTTDGIRSVGVVDPTTGRTDVFHGTSSPIKFISECLFEDNYDYPLQISVTSNPQYPIITVNLRNPSIPDKRYIKYVVRLTDGPELVKQVVIGPDEFDSYYNEYQHILSVNFPNLDDGKEYNIFVSFVDTNGTSLLNYLYKENRTSATAHGDAIGEFQLLQWIIDSNVTSGIYEINLTTSYHFTPWDLDYGKLLDHSCMNITNLDKPLVINGNGWALDARGYSRIFNITASYVTFNNVKFINGNSGGEFGAGNLTHPDVDIGGAIYWSGSHGVLNNCTFENNTASRGGAIYFNATASDCNISNCLFTENNASTYGGAIDCNASRMRLTNTTFDLNYADYGAALCREINATEGSGYNNTFSNNDAKTAGAALAWINASSIKIDTYFFYNNTAGYSGGAIYVGEGSVSCKVINCVFENNNVTNETGGHGGAIEWYAAEGLILNSSFTKNYAYDGGAVYIGTELGKINITNSNFTQNHAYLHGGAISLNSSSITINQSNFYYNTAINGGALYVGGEGETDYVYSSVFIGNVAQGNDQSSGIGGAIDWVASSGTIVDTNLTRNYANYGGGIYFGGKASESTVEHCNFTDNHAKYSGGAIDCNSSAMYLTNSIFDANYAQFGAALCREANAKGGHGGNNTFINNHAYVSGAALGWMGSINITIRNYTFINNSADVSGGAIYVSESSHNCSIINSRFENNYVTNKSKEGEFSWTAWDGTTMTYSLSVDPDQDPEKINKTIMYEQNTVYWYFGTYSTDIFGVGGAINILASNATIINSNFTNNTARLGGGFYVGSDSGNTIINGSIFRGNTAYERGGAINLHASATHINDSKFYDNVAINGSALYIGGVGTYNKVYKSHFEGNLAEGYGAGIYWRAHEGEIANSSFINNKATYGGGIYLNGVSANTNITNAIFKYNNATKNGGAIECNASNIGIYNITFESNYAGAYGAALCREVGATGGHGINNTFISNHAGISGAALAWLNVDNININYYYFYDNTADVSGGAIYVSEGSDNCIINNSDFRGNNVTNVTGGHGGAIDIVGDDATIINSKFTNNNAYYGGAIFAGTSSGNTNIKNVTFTRNSAVSDGGAIQIRGSGVSLNDTRFYSNLAGRSGGAIYVGGTGKNNVIYYSDFKDNTAGDHGGAVDWIASAGEIMHSNFTSNNAVYGGAVYLNGVSSESKISNVIFTSNIATKNGGAIDCNATKMNLTHTQFISNYAEYGAALCREANATGGFGGNNTFIANHAYKSGAALAWLGVDNITIRNYTFTNNTADVSGGAIYVAYHSDYCNVLNSTFNNNYVTDVRNGRGGAIDWNGHTGVVANSTFEDSLAVDGGAIYVNASADNFTVFNTSFVESHGLGSGGAIDLNSDNARITYSNFTYSIALKEGGVIAGHGADNTTIDHCIFHDNVGSGYVDSTDRNYGDGGVIYWTDANGLNISNSKFKDSESHGKGGSISAINTNNSIIYNSDFYGQFSLNGGGTVSWDNSRNVTIDSCNFTETAASFAGGSISLNHTYNATIKNSNFNNTSTPWGMGGAIYIDGNVTIDNDKFRDYKSQDGYGSAIYLYGGNSTISNSDFYGEDSIWINRGAEAYISKNNITGDNPNKNTSYLKDNSQLAAEATHYSVWNNGTLYLNKNNFGYVIFNNGTITSQTYLDILDNKTWNVTWNTSFTFFANITDDNDNTIISASTLKTWNSLGMGGTYNMTYNQYTTNTYFQANFIIYGSDAGLTNCVNRSGIVNVKMPTKLKITVSDEVNENITFTAKITTSYPTNYTIGENKKVHFVIGGEDYYGNITCFEEIIDGIKQLVAYANVTLNHMHTDTYKVTATFYEDDHHLNSTDDYLLVLKARQIELMINASDIYYGQTLICNVNSTAYNTENGWIYIRINGKEVARNIKLEKNGTKVVHITYDQYKDIIKGTGEYTLSVMFNNGTYYDYKLNFSTFNVKKFNTNISANVSTPISVGDPLIINVTVNETAQGFVKIIIDGKQYNEELNQGRAQFVIYGLGNGTYTDKVVEYAGSEFFNGNSTKITFTVNRKENYVMDVKAGDVYYHTNATIMVKLPTDATGNVTIWVNNDKHENISIINGSATLTLPDLACGDYIVNVTYVGDSSYAYNDFNGTKFTVKPYEDWKISVTPDEHPYGENSTYTITLPDDVMAKNVTVRIDGIVYVVNVTNHVAKLTLNNLSGGTHTANVTAGDANHASKTQIFRPQIAQADPSLIITRNGVDVVATVGGNVTGDVIFFINGVIYRNTTVDNVAVIKNILVVGANSVAAYYEGDKNYTKAVNGTTFDVDLLSSKVNVTATSVTYGSDSVITVKLPTTQTGYVTITVNDTLVNVTVKIVNGEAKFNASGLNVGRYRVNVTYLGDNRYLANKNFTYFNINKADLDASAIGLNVTVEENTGIVIGVPSEFKGNVKVNVSGIKYDNKPISLIDMGKFKAGSYTANVTFYGDNNYNIISIPVIFNVSKVNPTINVTIPDLTYPRDAVATINISNKANGTVRITIGTKEFNGVIANGVVEIPMAGLPAGNMAAKIEFISNDDYNNDITTYYNFIIFPNNSLITIHDKKGSYDVGEDITIRFETTNSSGDLKIYLDGEQWGDALHPNPHIHEVSFDGLPAGTYHVDAVLAGSQNYTGYTTGFTFNVVKKDVTIEVADINTPIVVDTKVTFTANLGKAVTGDVVFTINGANHTVHVSNANVATYDYTPVNNATISVIATFMGNGTYNPKASAQKDFNVNRITTSVHVSANPIIGGDDARIVVTMNPKINATVHLTVGTKPYDVAVVNGNGVYYVDGLGADTYNIEAVFDGDDRYANSSDTTTLEVSKIATHLSISLDKKSISVGDKAVVTIELDQSTNAVVTVKVNNNNNTVGLTTGTGTFTLSGLAKGTYYITAVFAGDDTRYNGSTSTTEVLTVDKIATEIGVSVAAPAIYGNDAIITVELDAAIDTIAKLHIDSNVYDVALVNGRGGFNASGLTSGDHSISAVFDENDKYYGDEDAKTFTVLSATLDAEVTALNVTVGENTKFVINVSDDFKGNVSIKVGNDLLYNGTVESLITGDKLALIGEKTATVVFYGDSNYNKRTLDNVKFNVTRATPTIDVVIDDVTYSNDAVAVINIGNRANGTVNITLSDGRKFNGTVSNGVANVHLTGLAAGTKEALVEFFTNDKYNENATASTKFTVNKNRSDVSISYDSVYHVGDTIQIQITTVNSTGDLNIYINGKIYTDEGLFNTNPGVYVIKPNLGDGDYIISAVLDGDENYTESVKNATFIVVKNDITSIEVADIATPIVVDAPVTFTANLGEAVYGDVIFTINGANYTVYISNADVATYTYTPINNTPLTVVATFMGSPEYNKKASDSKEFTVERIVTKIDVDVETPVTYGNDAIITIDLNATINATVKLTVDSKDYYVALVNGKGGFNASGLTSGGHQIAVVFAGDNRYKESNDNTGFNMGKATLDAGVTALNVTVAENTSFVIRGICDFNGNVSIKVGNDVLYNGTAKSLVTAAKLLAGDKTATVVFYGDDNYNTRTLDNVRFNVSRAVPIISVTVDDATYPNAAVAHITVGNNANGIVNITLSDGRKFNGTVSNGVANVPLTGLAAGSKVADVEFFSTDKYNDNATASAKFTVNKAASTIVVVVENVYLYGDGVIINLTATGSKASVNVTINGKVYPITAGNQVVIEKIAAGEYTIIAKLQGSENYTDAINSTVFKVKKAETSVSFVDWKSIYKVGEAIVITLDPINSTDLTVTINGENYPVGTGNKITIPKGLKAGDYIVTAMLAGNENYTESQDTKSFKVVKYDIEVTLDNIVAPAVGSPVTFTARLNESVTGDVIFTINGANYTVHVSDDNKATYEYTPATNATIAVVATFAGNDKYNSNVSAQKQFNANRISTGIDVSVATPVTYGGAAVITVTMDPSINATVVVRVGGKDYPVAVVNGVGKVDVYGLDATKYKVNATFSGNEIFSPSRDSTEFTVGKATADVNVVAGNVTYGEKVPITAFVNGTGSVTIEIEGFAPIDVDIVEGKAEKLIEGLSAGNYTIKVKYNGDGNVDSKTVEASFEVEKADPTITLNVKDIVYGNVEHIIITSNAPGNVTVKINGEIRVVELNLENGYTAILMASRWNVPTYNGNAAVDVDNLKVGNYLVEVSYNGNENYNKLVVSDDFDVVKDDTAISVEHDDSMKLHESQLINITINNTMANGKAIINIDGENHTVDVINGKANYTIKDLASGNHTVTIIYEGNDNLTGSLAQFNLEVTKLDADVDVTISNSTAGEKQTITVKVPSDATGQVLIDIGDEHYYANVTDGVAKLELDRLPEDSYDVVVTYLGDENYTAKSVTDKLTVTKINSTVDITPQSISVGDNEVITFTVPSDATGTITVVVGNETYTVPVSDGIGTLTIPKLPVGKYTVNATYNGDEKYASSTSSAEFEVAKASVPSDDIKVVDQGNGTVVVVVPSDLTGDVTVKVGDKPYNATIVNGTAVITLDDVAPGDHAIEVTYSGDENHNGTSTTSKVTVPKKDSSISISVGNSKVGENATVVVNVPSDATGNVTIEVDGKPYTALIKNGKATFNIPDLVDGNKTIVANYTGDDKYNGNVVTDSFEVSKMDCSVFAYVEDTEVGENVTVKVIVPSDATGVVLIDLDGVGYYAEIKDGIAIAQIPRVPSGDYDVNVTYTGDDKYSPSYASASLNVTKVDSFVGSKANDITAGEVEVLKFTLPEDATGTVTVVIDGVEYNFDVDDGMLSGTTESGGKFTAAVSNGYGELVVSGLTKGDYVVSVRYDGDDKYLPSTSTTKFTVNESKSDVNIDDDGNGTVVVVLPEDANGNVTVVIDGANSTATVENGTVNINLDNATPGKHNITIVYTDSTGKEYLINSTVEIPKYETPMSIEVSDAKVGQPVAVVVTVPDGVTGNITLEVDGKKYSSAVKNGKAQFNVLGLTEGGKTLVVKYGSDDYYVANMTTSQFSVSKVESSIKASSKDIVAGKDEVITVTLPSDATGRVLVTVDGVGYYANVVNGKAKITIPGLSSGKYKLSISYEGDDKYEPSSTTTSFTVSKGKSSSVSISADPIVEGQDAKIVVNVPEDATGTVTIVVDGKKYTSQVKDGKATFVVPGLSTGEHNIVAYYSGDVIYSSKGKLGEIDVYNPSNGNNGNAHASAAMEGVSLSDYPTGNPLVVLLLVILAIGTTQLRRFKR